MAELRLLPHMVTRAGAWYFQRKRVGRPVERESTGVKIEGVKGSPEWNRSARQAMPKIKEIEARWDALGERAKEVPTFGEWWKTYQETVVVKHAKKNNRFAVAHVLDKWRHLPLNLIKQSRCKQLLHSLAKSDKNPKGLAPNSVIWVHSVLSAIFEAAVDDEFLTKNPFVGKKIKKGKSIGRTQIMSPEEQTLLWPWLPPRLQRYITMLIGTGLRFSEAQAVVPEHMNRVSRLLHVPVGKGGKERWVPLALEVEQAIDAQWDAEGQGWPAHHATVSVWLNRATAKAGIAHLHPHVFRHTFATRYLQSPTGDIYILSKILGHTSVKVTEKQYAHLKAVDLVARSQGIDLGFTKHEEPPMAPKLALVAKIA